MVGLISARHTFSTFVFRYRENEGRLVDYDLTFNLVHVPKPDPKLERDPRMERLDPNEWKKQDHYVVLGLEEKRGQVCSTEDVRNAYRARVLVYHPDKIAQRNGKGKGKSQKDDAIFKCITKAFEVLNDTDRKAAFDSVDPTFDESIPSEKLPSGADFYATYGPVFDRNLRFSKTKTDLCLGDESTARDRVESFYQFWFDFDSVRRFDYLDEDDSECMDNRADKRYMEKKNKAARVKRKTDDNTRVRRLAENAYKLDPRIKAYKEADKAAKAAKKTAPKTGQRTAPVGSVEAKAKAEAEAKAKAEEEARVAVVTEAAKEAKKAKDAEASALRRERKALKTLFAENNYYVPTVLDSATKLKLLEEEVMLVEQICQKLDRLELAAVREIVQGVSEFSAVTNVLRERLGVALKEVKEAPTKEQVNCDEEVKPAATQPTAAPTSAEWNLHDMDLLINGTKKFPGGTRMRWETIAEWFNRQAQTQRSVDELLAKANELKASATQANGLGGLAGIDTSEPVLAPTKRDPRIDQNEPTLAISSTDAHIPWTTEEQAALELAIKAVPSDDAQRWESIATLVPSRTKKECMMRAKELATILKKKTTTA